MAETLRPRQKREIASHDQDTRLAYGIASELQTMDKVLLNEGMYRGLDVYRDLERDAKVQTVLSKRKALVMGAETIVTPGLRRGRTTREDERVADITREYIAHLGAEDNSAPTGSALAARVAFPTSFDTVIWGVLDAVLMGYAVGEVMWDVDGRTTGPREVRFREQRRFKVDTEHRIRLLTPDAAMGGITVPRKKFLWYVWGSLTDPYGRGLGHQLYHPVHFKRHGLSFWLRMLDKYGGPTVVAKSDREDEGSRDKLLEAARSVHMDAAVLINDDEALELLQTIQTAAQAGYQQLTQYLDNQIAQAALTVTLSTEITGQASRAASESHRGSEREVALSDTKSVSEFMTRTLGRWIRDFNSDSAAVPQIKKRLSNLSEQLDQSSIDTALFAIGYVRRLESVNRAYGDETDPDGTYQKVPKPKPPTAQPVASQPPTDDSLRNGPGVQPGAPDPDSAQASLPSEGDD